MQSLKEDKQFQHSTFLEYTIVLLIAFEVIVEVHALGWINWPPWVLRLTGQPVASALELEGQGQEGQQVAHAGHGRAKAQLAKRSSGS